jgi:hypothetical protein
LSPKSSTDRPIIKNRVPKRISDDISSILNGIYASGTPNQRELFLARVRPSAGLCVFNISNLKRRIFSQSVQLA